MNFDSLPESLHNAPHYVKELLLRTGKLIPSFFQEKCAQEGVTSKLLIEHSPELQYFIKADKEKQLVFGGDYMIFDKLF